MIVVVGNPLSGIGQVCIKYSKMFGTETCGLHDKIPPDETLFIFALPVKDQIDRIQELLKTNKIICMTICETETVHPVYGELFKLMKTFYVASYFCRDVFSRQFPDNEFKVLPLSVTPVVDRKTKLSLPQENPYVFYHIGNMIDPRKQIKKIIEAFIRLKMDNAILIIKATCNRKVELNIPNIYVINDLLPDEYIEYIHNTGDCYVSFSNSEGVGMGAVEAAVRDKPVIITEYGGAKDYIKTPYTISCKRKKVGYHDFLFTPDLEWGDPSFTQLCEFMSDAYTKKLKHMDHTHTRDFTDPKRLIELVSI